jgi:hypothetical protein
LFGFNSSGPKVRFYFGFYFGETRFHIVTQGSLRFGNLGIHEATASPEKHAVYPRYTYTIGLH